MVKVKSSRTLFLFLALLAVSVAGGVFIIKYFLGKNNRENIFQDYKLLKDSLYTFSYDYFQYNDSTGNAEIRNLNVTPDTTLISQMPEKVRPSMVVSLKIGYIKLKGVKIITKNGHKQIIGDSILIRHPEIQAYAVKPLAKNMKIETEALTVYKELLKKIHLFQVTYVQIDTVNLVSTDLFSGKQNFYLVNGNAVLNDVLIENRRKMDSTKIFFCRSANFSVDSLVGYKKNRKEFVLEKINFSGADKKIIVGKIRLNNMIKPGADAPLLLEASSLRVSGLNTNKAINEKSLEIDSIRCQEVKVYDPSGGAENPPAISKIKLVPDVVDTLTGFRNVYSLHLGSLVLEKVLFISRDPKKLDVGKISVVVNEVEARHLTDLEKNPLKHSKEVNILVDFIKINPDKQPYVYDFENLNFNSLQKNLVIGSASILPKLSESDFANLYPFQHDRFEVRARAVNLQGMEMADLFENKIIANRFIVQDVGLHIFRDLTKPLQEGSRVGNYPSQLLLALDIPVSVRQAALPSCNIEYSERKPLRQTGTIRFLKTSLLVNNITNIHEEIKVNPFLSVDYKSLVLGTIPINGQFIFDLRDTSGRFEASGHIESFEGAQLNEASLPMAFVRIRSGHFHKIDFDFKGDNYKAGGKFLMLYDNLKFDVLKKRNNADFQKKRGLLSLLANVMTRNSNPLQGDLRNLEVEHRRNIQKSFFNLVWKTLLKGMKNTIEN